MSAPFVVRPATEADRLELGQMAGDLVRFHYEIDPARFMPTPDRIEEGYGRWLAGESKNPRAVVLVAEGSEPLPCGSRLFGYAYATQEDRNWSDLLDAHGKIHDVFVRAGARKTGVAREIVQATCDRLTQMGLARIVLSTAMDNEKAQRVFASLGFRKTMIEMTRNK